MYYGGTVNLFFEKAILIRNWKYDPLSKDRNTSRLLIFGFLYLRFGCKL